MPKRRSKTPNARDILRQLIAIGHHINIINGSNQGNVSERENTTLFTHAHSEKYRSSGMARPNLAYRIKEYRSNPRYNFTISALAKYSQVSRDSIYSLLRGERISQQVAEKIIKALDNIAYRWVDFPERRGGKAGRDKKPAFIALNSPL